MGLDKNCLAEGKKKKISGHQASGLVDENVQGQQPAIPILGASSVPTAASVNELGFANGLSTPTTRTVRNELLCPPSMNLISECLIYRTPARQVFAVIGILVAFMQGGRLGEGVKGGGVGRSRRTCWDPLPQTLSCHWLQTSIVTR